MDNGLDNIRRTFANRFSPWSIRLPRPESLTPPGGVIQQAGWTIYFVFGSENGQDYLDYYASHRMTNEQIHRIYADGQTVLLAAVQEFHLAGDVQALQEFQERNRQFYKLADEIQARVQPK